MIYKFIYMHECEYLCRYLVKSIHMYKRLYSHTYTHIDTDIDRDSDLDRCKAIDIDTCVYMLVCNRMCLHIHIYTYT